MEISPRLAIRTFRKCGWLVAVSDKADFGSDNDDEKLLSGEK